MSKWIGLFFKIEFHKHYFHIFTFYFQKHIDTALLFIHTHSTHHLYPQCWQHKRWESILVAMVRPYWRSFVTWQTRPTQVTAIKHKDAHHAIADISHNASSLIGQNGPKLACLPKHHSKQSTAMIDIMSYTSAFWAALLLASHAIPHALFDILNISVGPDNGSHWT